MKLDHTVCCHFHLMPTVQYFSHWHCSFLFVNLSIYPERSGRYWWWNDFFQIQSNLRNRQCSSTVLEYACFLSSISKYSNVLYCLLPNSWTVTFTYTKSHYILKCLMHTKMLDLNPAFKQILALSYSIQY